MAQPHNDPECKTYYFTSDPTGGKKMKKHNLFHYGMFLLTAGFALTILASLAPMAAAKVVTASDMQGYKSKYPYQFELEEFEKQCKCKLS